jgi:drug/metabolite transporter (DMT)-like permease
VTGSLNTVAKKMGYNTCGDSNLANSDVTLCSAGYCGVEHPAPNGDTCDSCRTACEFGMHRFKKPWTQSLVMFTGEFMCIFLFFINRRAHYKKTEARIHKGHEALMGTTHDYENDENDAYRTITWKSSLICILPTCCDIGGTTLSGIGLLFTSASVFQMLRGSIIVFTAMMSVIFLKRKLLPYHMLGLALVISGVTCVGVSSLIGAGSSSGGSMVMLGECGQ